MPDSYSEKIQNAREAGQRAVAYKSYEALLTVTTTIDVFADLGDFATLGTIENIASSVNPFGVKLSVDGNDFGDTITLDPGEFLDMTKFIVFREIRLIHTLNANYKIVVA